MIRNLGPDFVYASAQDGFFPAVPAEDSAGLPHDFSDSAALVGADELTLTGQGAYDPFLGTSHLGILASPTTWAATLAFLTADKPRGAVAIGEGRPGGGPSSRTRCGRVVRRRRA